MSYHYSLSVGYFRIPPPIDSAHRLIRKPDLFPPTPAIRPFRRRVNTVYFIKIVSSATALATAVTTSAPVVRARWWTSGFLTRGVQVISRVLVARIWTWARTRRWARASAAFGAWFIWAIVARVAIARARPRWRTRSPTGSMLRTTIRAGIAVVVWRTRSRAAPAWWAARWVAPRPTATWRTVHVLVGRRSRASARRTGVLSRIVIHGRWWWRPRERRSSAIWWDWWWLMCDLRRKERSSGRNK